jgi:mono/diheme cytochrome c family protein
MSLNRWVLIGSGLFVVGCASAAATNPNVLTPLGARLTPTAKTGPQVPLRFDPNAHVVVARVAHLPAASYTSAQATRGKDIYEGSCANCHQSEKFIGPQFVEQWNDRRVGDFYSLIRNTMPVDNPGGLKEQDYLDVTAYLLQANHGPQTGDSLSTDTTVMRGRKMSMRNP